MECCRLVLIPKTWDFWSEQNRKHFQPAKLHCNKLTSSTLNLHKIETTQESFFILGKQIYHIEKGNVSIKLNMYSIKYHSS